MKPDWFVKSLLVVAVIFLGVVAFRPISQPQPVMAQDGSPYPFHIEHEMVSLPQVGRNNNMGEGRRRYAQRRRVGIPHAGAKHALSRVRAQ